MMSPAYGEHQPHTVVDMGTNSTTFLCHKCNDVWPCAVVMDAFLGKTSIPIITEQI
jgi:hypothetical protein